VRTISNDVLVLEEDLPWALFTFVEGNEYDYARVSQAIEAGRRLAQFHTVTDSFWQETDVLDINQMPDWWRNGEKEMHALEELFADMGVQVLVWSQGIQGCGGTAVQLPYVAPELRCASPFLQAKGHDCCCLGGQESGNRTFIIHSRDIAGTVRDTLHQ